MNRLATIALASALAGCTNSQNVAAICAAGYARSARPPVWYTETVKYATAGFDGRTVRASELDHIVPLELGGSAWSVRNMQLQPWREARQKDRAEDRLHWQVCHGQTSLREAQYLMITWRRRR